MNDSDDENLMREFGEDDDGMGWAPDNPYPDPDPYEDEEE